ncbi:hypothetical protein I4U23_004883 [Adineta vaga]|nr:hypothetical protein I4U23_004883 [Adineta vaga]
MAGKTSKNEYYNDDETNDNASDEDDWLKETNQIVRRCPSVNLLDQYYQPEEFETKFVTYGDGGSATLQYPIWIFDGLSNSINDNNTDVREELLQTFYQLNDQRKDFHKYPSPVEDIIDPDLLPYKPSGPPLTLNLSSDDDHPNYDSDEDTTENETNATSSFLRDTYQWTPSEFRIVHDIDKCEVHIETPINHLPMTQQYETTYRNLEKIFVKLVPMFGEILRLNTSKGDTRLQVIVKVQSYNLQPGVKYSGRWHTEGRTENIEAVGVYYLYIDDELEGGALKFRPSRTPDKTYAEWSNIEVNRYVMPRTDTAIVFANSLPHRFCSMRNATSIARRRTFINFFVVSPNYPIDSLSISDFPLVSYEQCRSLLAKIEDEYQRTILPDLVIEKILSFLKNNMWKMDEDAKEFRGRVRRELLDEKSGWAGIHFGNSGDIVFIKSNADLSRKERRSGSHNVPSVLDHTESD